MSSKDRIQHLSNQIINKPQKITCSDKCKVDIKCANCDAICNISVRNLCRKWADKLYLCKSCHVRTYASNPEKIKKFKRSFKPNRQKCREAGKKSWLVPDMKERIVKGLDRYNKNNPNKIKETREKAVKAFHKKYGKEIFDKMRIKSHESIRQLHKNNPEFRKKMHDNLKLSDPDINKKQREGISRESKRRWDNPEYKKKYQTEEHKERMREIAKAAWTDQEYRQRMLDLYSTSEWKEAASKRSKEIHQRPSVKLAQARALQEQGKTSKLEDIFASILDDHSIRYYRQHKVGWYLFDFMIPSEPKDLLIEINGLYFHSLPEQQSRDAAKATYITRYFSDKYELKTIWEQEFGSKERIINIIKSYMGNKSNDVEFAFDDLRVERSEDIQAVRIFLSKYHYIGKIGRYTFVVQCKFR